MKNLLSIFRNKEDVTINNQIREIYNKIDSEIPKKIEDLNKKYEFNLTDYIITGSSSIFYNMGNGLGGKVLCNTESKSENRRIVSLKESNLAFKKIRKEFINYKIGLELDVRLAENSEIVMAKEIESKNYFPMIINRNLGNVAVDDPKMNYIKRKLSRENFEVEVKKLMPYLKHPNRINLKRLGNDMTKAEFVTNRTLGSDICYANSRWDEKNQKAYFTDTEKWKFKGLFL